MFKIFKKNKKNNPLDRKKKPTYWERVIYGKGTVAEPWPTGEELWNDPEIQKIIKWNNELGKKKSQPLN